MQWIKLREMVNLQKSTFPKVNAKQNDEKDQNDIFGKLNISPYNPV
jgi:hypothetical protein